MEGFPSNFVTEIYYTMLGKKKIKLVLGFDLVVPGYSHLGEAGVFAGEIFNSWFKSIRIFILNQKENRGKWVKYLFSLVMPNKTFLQYQDNK